MKKISIIAAVLLCAISFASCTVVINNKKVNSPENNPPESYEYIGEAKAKEIALSKWNLKEDEVVFDRIELDRERNVICYEVEFRKGFTEYNVDVSAVDGTIIDSDADYFD